MTLKNPSLKFGGLFARRERWGLSGRGWLALILFVLLVGWFFLWSVQPFLAVTRRVPTKILVVEGWIHDYGVAAAVQEFNSGNYTQIYATGGPVEGIGPTSSVYDTEAHRTAGILVKAGIPANEVQSVPSCFVGKDRTYSSGIALRDWFRDQKVSVSGVNVLTEDAHARRTWMLFQEALGPEIKVGIISVHSPDYDARHWWRSSAGVREVIDEGIAYIYAKFFFWPAL